MIKKEDIRKGDAIRIRIAFLREPDAIRMIDEGIVDGKCVLYVDYFDANYVVCYQRGFAYNKDYNVNDIAIPTDVFCKEAIMLLSNKAAKELNESLQEEEQCRKEQVSNQGIVDSNKSLHECLGKANEAAKKMFESFSFEEITNKMLETYIKKNHDYGNAFSDIYDELGINYGYGKIREKVNRIKTLKDGDAMVENEPLEDALLDCANYCILTLMEYQKHKKDGKD